MTVTRPVANFGVVVLSARPRLSRESSSPATRTTLTGVPGLPLVINPYIDSYGAARPVAGAIRPGRGQLRHRLRHRRPRARGRVHVPVLDRRRHARRPCGCSSRTRETRRERFELAVDRRRRRRRSAVARPRRSTAGPRRSPTREAARSSASRAAGPGRHRVVFTAADYQEMKNMENVPRILPNTRTFTAAFRVR